MSQKQYAGYWRAQAAIDGRQRPLDESLYSEDAATWHFIYGLKCGYPLCCVLWFCTMFSLWSTGNHDDDFNKPAGNGYAMCPDCTMRQIKA